MAQCSRCKETIEFKPHPISGKLSPFSLNGEIHFATCKLNRKEKNFDLVSIKNTICQCGAKFRYVYWGQITGGVRLRIAFDCSHKGYFLQQTDQNISLINTTEMKYLETMIAEGKDKWGNLSQRLKEVMNLTS